MGMADQVTELDQRLAKLFELNSAVYAAGKRWGFSNRDLRLSQERFQSYVESSLWLRSLDQNGWCLMLTPSAREMRLEIA